MKKKLGSLMLLGAVASVAVVFGAMGPAGSQPPAERQTVTLFDPQKTNFEKFLNEGRRGISSGDTVLFRERQLDPETCERVGTLTGRIQVIKVAGERDAHYLGEFSVNLQGGKITAAGAAKFSDFEGTDPVFAVTGGTETYRDASGEVSFQENVEFCDRKGDLTTIDVGPRP